MFGVLENSLSIPLREVLFDSFDPYVSTTGLALTLALSLLATISLLIRPSSPIADTSQLISYKIR